jgi:hypothetical protein
MEFMKLYPELFLDRAKQTPLPASTMKDYTARTKALIEDMRARDNFISAFVNHAATIRNIREAISTKTHKPYEYNTIIKKIAILSSIARALKKGGLFKKITDEQFEYLCDKYAAVINEKRVEKAVVEISNRNNAEYAVPEWSVLEDDVVNEFGHGSIQHVITVLYRYNTVRNDYVNRPVYFKKYETGDPYGFYVVFKKLTKMRFVSSRKKTGYKNGVMDLIDYTYDPRATAVITEFIKTNHIQDGQDLLPKSISGIVKDMMTRVGVVMPPNAKPISIFRNIDSGMGGSIDPKAFAEKAKQSGHSVATKMNIYARVKSD